MVTSRSLLATSTPSLRRLETELSLRARRCRSAWIRTGPGPDLEALAARSLDYAAAVRIMGTPRPRASVAAVRTALFARLFAALIALAVMSACSRPKTSLDAPLQDGDFAFLMGWGNGWHGFSVLRVAADGQSSYLYRRDDRWWLVKFEVKRELVTALREKLEELGYFALAAEYSIGATDGDQAFVKVREGQRRHAVYVDNEFPHEVELLRDYVRQNLLPQGNGALPEPVDYDSASEDIPHDATDVP
jgi:hypothetical protein